MQISGYVITVLKLAEESFVAYRDQRLDEEIWLTRADFALNTLSRKQARENWESMRPNGVFVQGFIDWFDAALAERYGE